MGDRRYDSACLAANTLVDPLFLQVQSLSLPALLLPNPPDLAPTALPLPPTPPLPLSTTPKANPPPLFSAAPVLPPTLPPSATLPTPALARQSPLSSADTPVAALDPSALPSSVRSSSGTSSTPSPQNEAAHQTCSPSSAARISIMRTLRSF